ncbi:toxin glutamine deamidase domain-containing protein [Nocardia sp. NPDC006044]|uniref:toxin glutamine deamidase domain-containing protein n=1 Tax=Nocardia sp. NPDC006044 TaxID=3364306 RepID=UPI0036AEC6EB
MAAETGAAHALKLMADGIVHELDGRLTPAMADVLWTSGGQLRHTADVLRTGDALSMGNLDAHQLDFTNGSAMAHRSTPSDHFEWFHQASSAQQTNSDIDKCLVMVNPGFDRHDPQWANNCAVVATTYELRRRGEDVIAGPAPLTVRSGVPHVVTEMAWGRGFTTVMSRERLLTAFSEPGSRGIVIADWPPEHRLDRGASHLFNVEHVHGAGVRFVDGQPNPPLVDASEHVRNAAALRYLRVDDLRAPLPSTVADLGIQYRGTEGGL